MRCVDGEFGCSRVENKRHVVDDVDHSRRDRPDDQRLAPLQRQTLQDGGVNVDGREERGIALTCDTVLLSELPDSDDVGRRT